MMWARYGFSDSFVRASVWCCRCWATSGLVLRAGEFWCELHAPGLTPVDSMSAMESTCACGAPATVNGRECAEHWRERISTVNTAFAPTRTAGAGQIDPEKSRRWDSRLEDYAKVRHEGSQPQTTRRRDIEAAKRISDATQEAFRADRANRALQGVA